MVDASRSRLERTTALVALAATFAGVGAVGWLVGHVATYDALGRAHQHAGHHYMQPVQQGGSTVAVAGIVLAFLVALVGGRPLARWLGAWRRSDSLLPWVAAATIPAASFLAVELLEGSLAARGAGLIFLGVPLQALIGLLVLALVRALLGVLLDVATQLVGSAPRTVVRSPLSIAPARTGFLPSAPAPMASSASLRGPPGIRAVS